MLYCIFNVFKGLRSILKFSKSSNQNDYDFDIISDNIESFLMDSFYY